MATEGPLIHDGGQCVAGQNFSNTAGLKGMQTSGQFLAVKMSTATDRNVILATTGGEAIYGILQNKPASGYAADIGIFGVTKAMAGGTVTVGQRLMTDTYGRLVAATGTNHGVARCIEGGATDTLVTVEVLDLGTIA